MALPRHQARTTNELPIIDTPFTRMVEHIWTHQGGPCRDYEMDYTRCVGNVGHKRAEQLCTKFMDDWMECAYKTKTIKRYEAIRAERKRQGKEFLPPPDKDSFHIPQGHQ